MGRKKTQSLDTWLCTGMFDFLDVCSFLRHEMCMFVHSEFVRRPTAPASRAKSVNHLGMDEHDDSRHDELNFIENGGQLFA